jgi:hypothetical protein
MSRYSAQVESAATLAVDTSFAWLMCTAAAGFKLRRVTLGITTTTAVVPTSQQCTVGINRVSTAGTTPVTGTVNPLDPNATTGLVVFDTGFTTPPTLAAQDAYRAAFNTQSGADLPWEQLEEFVVPKGTTNGLAFVNRDLALPSNHKLVLSVEWEE